MTQELLAVVVREADGAPEPAPLVAVAPIAPEPFVPDVLIPVKLITVIEEAAGRDSVAETDTFVSADVEKLRQISDVPRCLLALTTNTQVRPPPVTLVTVLLVPEDDWTSAETKASSNSFGDVVEKGGVVTVVLGDP